MEFRKKAYFQTGLKPGMSGYEVTAAPQVETSQLKARAAARDARGGAHLRW